jgi:uncharacterized protein YjbJ (UPF0337 family)
MTRLDGTGEILSGLLREDKMGEIIDKNKGKIKQTVAGLTGDKKLKREGERDVLKGRVKGVVRNVERAVKSAVK